MPAACVTVNKTDTSNASFVCDLGASVTWSKGDRVALSVPVTATQPLVTLTNRATVTDNLNRSANATARVATDLPQTPNSVSDSIA